ncbi:MAG TPA: hypothetical protein VIF57_06795 [Polyangia bacterium]|jgi:hypothetical protein
MATHILVNPDVITSTTFERAFLDVSGEPLNADVTFTVFGIGAPSSRTATVPMNAQNFATSPELFDLSAKKTALIIARTTDPTTPSTAVLRQSLGPIKEALTIPSSNIMQGRAFNLPIGDLSGGGNLYVGNPHAADALIDLQYGDSNAPIISPVTVSPTSALKIPIAPTPINTNLIINVRSDFPVVVQAVIGTRFLVVYPIGPAV